MIDTLEPKEGDRIEKPYDPDVNKGFTHTSPPPKPNIQPTILPPTPPIPPPQTPKK